MTRKYIALRYQASCVGCRTVLKPGTKAFHDRSTRAVTCVRCAHPPIAPDSEPAVANAAPSLIDTGQPGSVPQAEYERRRANRDERLKQRWGRFAPIVRSLASEPQNITAFRKGAEGERKLAERLEKAVGDNAILLHSRKIARGDIDHVAVAPSNIFVIDAKHYSGRVEVRDVGGWRKVDRRLFVGGRDRSLLIDGVNRQVEWVQRAIEPTQFVGTAVVGVLCFVGADWSFFAMPFRINGVTTMWPKRLCEEINRPGPMVADDREGLAAVLSAALPPAH